MPLFRYFAPLLISVLLAAPVLAADPAPEYHYISAADLEARLNAGQPTNLVDIQVEEEFAQHHIKGATATHAYPVKSEADRAKLDRVVGELKANNDPVVIVCPRGAGGARRTHDYLLSRGIDAKRILILEKGQEGWSCAPLTKSQ